MTEIMTLNERIDWAMERLDAAKERAKSLPLYSQQDRFKSDRKRFESFYKLHKTYLQDKDKYPYHKDSRKRDAWLREFWKLEPHLAGVLNSVVAIDKNRSWTMTGTERQVMLYSNILRYAEDGLGWKDFCSIASQSFYSADINTIVEIGRDTSGGPTRALYTVDPTLCKLTDNRDYPLTYYGKKSAKEKKWGRNDFFRVMSMPSTDETFNRLGLCAVSRALELICLLMSIYEYDQEQLGARAPKGLLLLQNISQLQWDEAMTHREEELNRLERDYFGGVAVLAQEGMDQIDAKVVALSNLPQEFDRETVTNQIMYGVSLCFGYTADEFWPVQYGALGRSRETEIQHMRATSKGGSDFVLGFQDKFQREIPPTVLFEFDKRDSETDLLEAEVYFEWGRVARELYAKGEGPLDREEIRSLLASKGIIDPEWTELAEDSIATDSGKKRTIGEISLKNLREELLTKAPIVRSVREFSDEPVVRYQYPQNKITYVWEKGEHATQRRLY